jgi:hypothetical protein
MTELLNLARQGLADEQLWVNPDCGLKTRKWEEVRPALVNMVEATKQIRELAACFSAVLSTSPSTTPLPPVVNNNGLHGFLHRGGAHTTLDDPSATKGTIAAGINAAGQIVGQYTDASNHVHGFLLTITPR